MSSSDKQQVVFSESGVGFERHDADLVMFSCGHVLSRAQLESARLKVQSWKTTPVASQLVFAEFQRVPTIGQSCKCVCHFYANF